MSKKLILHIGAEKTATTAIQGCLSKNRQLLKELSIIYPETSFSKDAHFSLVAALHEIDHGKMLEFAPPGEYTYESEWLPLIEKFKALDDGSTMILSAEHFSSRLKDKGLAKLSEIIAEFNADTLEVVYYFRRQDLYFQSWYSTYIKAGGVKKVSEIYPDLIKDKWFFDFNFVREKWECYLPNAKVSLHSFDSIRKSGSILEHFFSNYVCTKVENFDFNIEKEDSNLSWSSQMIALGRAINTIYGQNLNCRYMILENINKKIFKKKGGGNIISARTSKQILLQYETENMKICEKLNLQYEDVFKNIEYHEYEDPDDVRFTKESILDLLIESPVWK